MLVNNANLRAISQGFSKVFAEQLKVGSGEYEKIATVVKSNSLVVDYAWLGDTPRMKEWLGDRVLRDIKAFTYQLPMKSFESTIEVAKDDIEGDNLGIVKPRIQALASDALSHYDELVFHLLELNGNSFDGASFFGTHRVGNDIKTYKNESTKALSLASLLEARSAMRSIRSEEDRPLKIVPNLLVIPRELEVTAMELLKRDVNEKGESNITKGIVEYVVCDYLTDPKAWYLFDTTKPLKPLILQKYRDITFVSMDKEDDENVFMRDKFRYGVYAKHNAGYGLWQLAHKSLGTDE